MDEQIRARKNKDHKITWSRFKYKDMDYIMIDMKTDIDTDIDIDYRYHKPLQLLKVY